MTTDPALRPMAVAIEEGQPWPRPSCPSCESGHIRFGKPETAESHASASARSHFAFEPEWVAGTFSVLGECENPECRQKMHGAGDYTVAYAKKSVSDEPWQDPQPEYSEYYQLSLLYPAPRLIQPPKSAPGEVQEALLRAARVLLADAGLAGTALRASVERFLTSEGIPAVDSSGRFRNAHVRIQEWGATDPGRKSVVSLFLAVKWLGNAGTHEDSDLTILEILEGADVLMRPFTAFTRAPTLTPARSRSTAPGGRAAAHDERHSSAAKRLSLRERQSRLPKRTALVAIRSNNDAPDWLVDRPRNSPRE